MMTVEPRSKKVSQIIEQEIKEEKKKFFFLPR